MSFSPVGLLGAALGLYIGWLDSKILFGVLQAAVLKRKQGRVGETFWLEKAEPHLRKIIFCIMMIGFPIIGYLAGASIAG
ncbi:hypothetical protein [Flexibacterium corallicola]|uniref:hypothetical protein n=1 Tax=Flexibacterium corallicola TaxID=3037259 RepID=UPI0038620FC3